MITHSRCTSRITNPTVWYIACSEVSGNAHLVAHRILEKLPQEDR